MNVKPMIEAVKPVARELVKVVALAAADKVATIIKDKIENKNDNLNNDKKDTKK